MASYNDSDTSSESEYESDQGSIPRSNCDKDETLNLELEYNEPLDSKEFEDGLWNPQAQLNAIQLAQLYADIKARVELPIPIYLKLSRHWPFRLFDI